MAAPPDSNLPTPRQLLQRQPLVAGLAALCLAGIAQYALAGNQTLVAAVGYFLAAVIALVALRPAMPENFVTEAPAPEPEAARGAPAETGETVTPNFWSHWRYYTLHDLLTGKRPSIPIPPAAPPAPGPEALPKELPPSQLAGSAAPGSPTESLASNADLKRAVVTVWSGFVEPPAVVVTHQGHVLVVDVGQRRVFRYSAQGQPLEQWAIPDLPPLQIANLAASPDGRTLYLADAVKREVHVLTLEP